MEEEQVVKISELEPVNNLYDGCCMPIVQFDETKKVTYQTLKNQLNNDLDFVKDTDALEREMEALQDAEALQNQAIEDLRNGYRNKVDKVVGKGLSTNDYTDEDKAKVWEIPDTLYANGADYAEVGEWEDGNPKGEDRLYRFVTLKGNGRRMAIANSTDQIAGVTNNKAAFVGNAEGYDESDKTKNIIGIIGVVPVKTKDSTIQVNDRVMSDDDGYAVKSANNLGYRVLEVLEDGKLEIVVSVNTDMIQRIKTDMDDAEAKINELVELLPQKTATGTNSLEYNSAKEANLLGAEYKGNVEQETTSGKNLWDYSKFYFPDQTINGVTLKNNGDGSFSIKGTATNNFNFNAIGFSVDNYIEIQTGNYTQQFAERLGLYDVNGNWKVNTYKTFTITEILRVRSAFIAIQSGKEYNQTLYYQLEKGENATDFEPFTNGASPNPDYPQEIEVLKGYNLFDKDTCLFTDKKRYDDNGSIVNDNYSSYSTLIEVRPNTTYTIQNLNGTTNRGVRTALFDINKSFIKRTTSELTNNITITTDNNTYYLSIQGRELTSMDINTIQLTKGTEQKPYLPYGMIGIRHSGKNLFDKDTVVYDKLVNRDTGQIYTTTAGTYATSDFIEVKENTKYTTTNCLMYYSALYDKNKNYIGHLPSNIATFTTLENAKYMRVSVQIVNINKVQFEIGEIATPYTSFQESIQYINLDGNEVLTDDELRIDRKGKVKLIKKWGKVVLDGSENITADSDYISIGRFDIQNYNDGIKGNSTNPGAISTHFISKFATDGNYIFLSGVNRNINIINKNYKSDLNGFKQWLSQNKPIVYYQLATPVEIELPDTTPLYTLEGYNNVEVLATLEPTAMSETYAIDTIKYIDEKLVKLQVH